MCSVDQRYVIVDIFVILGLIVSHFIGYYNKFPFFFKLRPIILSMYLIVNLKIYCLLGFSLMDSVSIKYENKSASTDVQSATIGILNVVQISIRKDFFNKTKDTGNNISSLHMFK